MERAARLPPVTLAMHRRMPKGADRRRSLPAARSNFFVGVLLAPGTAHGAAGDTMPARGPLALAAGSVAARAALALQAFCAGCPPGGDIPRGVNGSGTATSAENLILLNLAPEPSASPDEDLRI